MENNFDNTPDNNDMPKDTYSDPNAGQQYTDPNAGQTNTEAGAGQSYTDPNAGQSYTDPNAGQSYTDPNAGQSYTDANAGQQYYGNANQNQQYNYQQYQNGTGQQGGYNYQDNYNYNVGNNTGYNRTYDTGMDTSPMSLGDWVLTMRRHRAIFCMGVREERQCKPQELLPCLLDHYRRGSGHLHHLYGDIRRCRLQFGGLLLNKRIPSVHLNRGDF